MPKDPATDERTPPKFAIDRKQGLRHILHSAIRMLLDGEDAFAINVLSQSADKVLIDLLKHNKIDDPALFEDRIVPEHRKEFFRMHRQTFNFLKHAKEDPDGTLPVYDLVSSNELLLFVNVLRFKALYTEITTHMQTLFALAAILHPTLIKWKNLGEAGEKSIRDRNTFEHWTKNEAIKLVRDNCYNDGKFLKERADDLKLVSESHHLRLSGKSGPTRLRIPTNN
jgi:hypothetical protein